jgi:large conductance mechanosensitive channel
MLKEFKDWIMKGNLLEIAIGLVLALAFASVVEAFTKNIVTPIIGAVGGTPDFANKSFTINKSVFTYGLFINALIMFIITAFVLFLVMKAASKAMKAKAAEPTQYIVEQVDAAALNARSAEGWEVVSATDQGVVLKK